MRFINKWSKGKVAKITQVGATVKLFEIELPYEMNYTPGAHIDVQVYVNEQPEVRSYSLIGRVKKDKLARIAVKLLPHSRGGSKYMWSLKKGQMLRVSQVKNHFELNYGHENYVLIAGGIGITPMLAMAEELVLRKVDFKFYYLASSREDMPFLDNLKTMLGDKLETYIASEGRRFSIADMVTKVTKDTQVYLCGPMGILEEARSAWHRCKLPIQNLRFETFGTTGLYPTGAFKLNIPRFEKSIIVEASESILDAASKAGVDLMYDCKKGECGLCQVEILSHSGIVDHRDVFFSQKEKDFGKKLCACVSRVYDGEITIDTSFRD